MPQGPIATELAQLAGGDRARRKAEILHQAVVEFLPYSWADGELSIIVTSVLVTEASDLSVSLTAVLAGRVLALDLPFVYHNPPVISSTGDAHAPVMTEHPLRAFRQIIAETVRSQA